jgi:hypothetical protein
MDHTIPLGHIRQDRKHLKCKVFFASGRSKIRPLALTTLHSVATIGLFKGVSIMPQSFIADLVDFAADKEDELLSVFAEQLRDEEEEQSVDFDDYSR